MDLSQRVVSIVAIALIVTGILTVLTVVLTGAGSSDKDPFEDDEIAEFLTDVEENSGLLQAAGAVGILNDGIFLPIVAAGFFILFRDRSPFLATVSMVGLAMTAVISLIVDISNVLMTFLAEDYVNGGPGDIAAGDSTTLPLAQYVAITTFAYTNLLFTPAAISLLALGTLLVGAPQGLINPPKWIGWVTIVSGLSAGLAWLVVLADPGFIFFPLQLLTLLILTVSLGVWLLRNSDLQTAPMKA